MRRSEQCRSRVLSGPLAVVLLMITAAWSPAHPALAVEGGTPVAENGCRSAAVRLPSEELPTGVVREAWFTTGIDSAATPAPSAVASIVCIAANTEVVVGTDGGGPTKEIPQDYTVTLVVLEGELELKVVKSCAPPDPTAPCTTNTGQATFRTEADFATQVAIGANWTPIPTGSTVVLADVTISMRTTADTVRLLSTGVVPDILGGGACPSSCGQWRYP